MAVRSHHVTPMSRNGPPGEWHSLVMERTDAELLVRSAQDPEAFGIFYDRYAERLLTYFARRTWDAQDTADLTAETFAAAFAARRR
jgi:hypothetical protein